VRGVAEVELLQPRRLYRRQGREAEYEAMVERLHSERREYLAGFAALDPAVIEGLRP
jgi:phosphoenolpyruvate carboxykinase (ATP)